MKVPLASSPASHSLRQQPTAIVLRPTVLHAPKPQMHAAPAHDRQPLLLSTAAGCLQGKAFIRTGKGIGSQVCCRGSGGETLSIRDLCMKAATGMCEGFVRVLLVNDALQEGGA